MPYEPVHVFGEDETNDRISTYNATGRIATYLNGRQANDKPGFRAEIAVQANK